MNKRYKTQENLDKAMDKKWKALRADCPEYGMRWINGMHELLDWYEKEKTKIVNDHE